MAINRALLVLNILKENTNEDTGLSIKEIITILKDSGYNVTRNTVRSDISSLIDEGFNIRETKGRSNISYFHYSSEFSVEECRIILDSINSNKFIKRNIKNKIIDKILDNVSYKDKRKLRNCTLVKNLNTENIDINENLFILDRAIYNNLYISFSKTTRDLNKKIIIYSEVNNFIPKEIYFHNNRYYLIGLNYKNEIRHYRIDRLANISCKENHNNRENINLSSYEFINFDMFNANKVERVELKVNIYLINSIIEKLGEDVSVRKCLDDKNYFIASKLLGINKGLIRWILKQGVDVEVISPQSLIDDLRIEIEKMRNLYKK